MHAADRFLPEATYASLIRVKPRTYNEGLLTVEMDMAVWIVGHDDEAEFLMCIAPVILRDFLRLSPLNSVLLIRRIYPNISTS